MKNWKPYEIEKDIPVPPPGRWEERKNKYPFKQMEIGDSFYVPKETFGGKKLSGQHFSGMMRFLKPKKFITRRDDNGIRIWRVE